MAKEKEKDLGEGGNGRQFSQTRDGREKANAEEAQGSQRLSLPPRPPFAVPPRQTSPSAPSLPSPLPVDEKVQKKQLFTQLVHFDQKITLTRKPSKAFITTTKGSSR